VKKPDLGYFLEIKSRTWSRRDADHKAEVSIDLLNLLGAAGKDSVPQDYLELAQESLGG